MLGEVHRDNTGRSPLPEIGSSHPCIHAYRDVCHNPCLRWLRQAGAVAVIILASVIPCIAQSHHGTPPVWWPCRIYVLKAICAPVPFSKSIYIFNPAVQENTAGSALNVHLLLSRKAHDTAK